MSEISIDAWMWLYKNRSDLKFTPDRVSAHYINSFIREKLLVYKKGKLSLTNDSAEIIKGIDEEERRLRTGIPFSQKNTISTLDTLQCEFWFRGMTKERKDFITNYEIILFSKAFRGFTIIDSPNLLDIELIISQVRLAVFSEAYIDLSRLYLQRDNYFTPGVIWLGGEKNYKISIDELYHDMVIAHWSKVRTNCSFLAVAAGGKELVVVTNPNVDSRYFEDIIAIIAPCVLECE